MDKLTIITPCIRYQNLIKISETIPKGVRWIVIFDANVLPDKKYIPNNAEIYTLKAPTRGYPQSNLGIDKVDDGLIYFLDDDTLFHSGLIKKLSDVGDFDFIHFNQSFPDGRKRVGGEVKVGKIDKGSFVIKRSLIGNDRFDNCASADGMFAEKMYKKAKTTLYINDNLSIYNALRPVEKDKFTIIIPTMWYHPELLYKAINKYQDCDLITEILIVNNREEGRIDLPFNKVRIIGSGKNIFVNPAWNLAVKHSKSDKLVFANDDIELVGDLNLFLKFIAINLKDGMAIGPHSNCISIYNYKNEKFPFSLQRGGSSMMAGSGVFMIMNKNSYHAVPKELQIWHGDLIQYEVNEYYVFKGISINTQMRGTTSILMTNSESKEKVLEERKFYLWYKANGYKMDLVKEKVNVMLVMRSGGAYTLKDVLLLSSHIYKNSNNLDVTIYCLTDLIESEVIIDKVHLLPIIKDWSGWWAKMNIFSPKYEYLRPFIFIDLDSCLTGAFSLVLPVDHYRDKFITLEDFYKRGSLASGVMWLPSKNAKVTKIWEQWISNPNNVMSRFRGDQEFIRSVVSSDVFWQDFKKCIVTFKPNGRLRFALKEDDVLVCFHGTPKIWEAGKKVKWVNDYIKQYHE